MFNTKKAVEEKSYRLKAKRRVDASIVLSVAGVVLLVSYSFLTGKADEALQGLKVAGFFMVMLLGGLIAMSGFSVVSLLFDGIGKSVRIRLKAFFVGADPLHSKTTNNE